MVIDAIGGHLTESRRHTSPGRLSPAHLAELGSSLMTGTLAKAADNPMTSTARPRSTGLVGVRQRTYAYTSGARNGKS